MLHTIRLLEESIADAIGTQLPAVVEPLGNIVSTYSGKLSEISRNAMGTTLDNSLAIRIENIIREFDTELKDYQTTVKHTDNADASNSSKFVDTIRQRLSSLSKVLKYNPSVSEFKAELGKLSSVVSVIANDKTVKSLVGSLAYSNPVTALAYELVNKGEV